MLKMKGIRDDGKERLFEILIAGAPASSQDLATVARIATLLIEENELPGSFHVAGDGVLALELDAPRRSFFHNGIVFAALDAVNDPVKNPTLTRLGLDLPEPDPR